MRMKLCTSFMLLWAIPKAKKANVEHVGMTITRNFQGGVSKMEVPAVIKKKLCGIFSGKSLFSFSLEFPRLPTNLEFFFPEKYVLNHPCLDFYCNLLGILAASYLVICHI